MIEERIFESWAAFSKAKRPMRIRTKKAKYFINKKSKSIYDSYGKIIQFSYEDYIANIVKGNCCFICGAEPGSKPFNSEHVIPHWILRHFGEDDS